MAGRIVKDFCCMRTQPLVHFIAKDVTALKLGLGAILCWIVWELVARITSPEKSNHACVCHTNAAWRMVLPLNPKP